MGGMCDGGVGHIQGQTQVVCRPERPRRWNSCRRASSKPTAACLLAQSEVVVVGGSVMQVATRLDAWRWRRLTICESCNAGTTRSTCNGDHVAMVALDHCVCAGLKCV